MLRIIREMYCEFIETIKDIKNDPIGSLSLLIPAVIFLMVFGAGIASYVMFIVNGGYTIQIDSVKESGIFEGYADRYTLGTIGVMFNSYIVKTAIVLAIIEFVLMMVSFFINNGMAKIITMVIDLVILVIQGRYIFWSFKEFLIGICATNGDIPETLELLEQSGLTTKTFLFVAVITLILLITYITLLVTTYECERIIKQFLESLLASFGITPLIFIFLQNVIALVTSVFAIILVAIFVFCIIGAIREEGSTASTSTSTSATSKSSDNSRSSSDYNSFSETKKKDKGKGEGKEMKRDKKQFVRGKNCVYIPDINAFLGVKLYKVHGFLNDYIAVDNGIGSSELCSLEKFNKGEFHIYESETGREIKSEEIPWRN